MSTDVTEIALPVGAGARYRRRNLRKLGMLAASCGVLALALVLGVPLAALTRLDIPTFPADLIPPELAAVPAIKPGSRGLK